MDRSEKDKLYIDEGLYLYIEERCRFGKRGAMLSPEDVPNDGLCRVIVDYHSTGPAVRSNDEWAAARRQPYRYPNMVALAAAELAGPSGWLWSAGEAPLYQVDMLEESLGRAVARFPDLRRTFALTSGSIGHGIAALAGGGGSTPLPHGSPLRRVHTDDLIVWRISCRDITPTIVVPNFKNSEAPRTFAFDTPGTDLERDIATLERAVLEKRSDALPRWDTINQKSYQRGDILRMCEDTVAIVLLDGPHGSNAGVYSTRLTVQALVDAFHVIAKQAGVCCVEIPNTGSEYRMLHM